MVPAFIQLRRGKRVVRVFRGSPHPAFRLHRISARRAGHLLPGVEKDIGGCSILDSLRTAFIMAVQFILILL
jgi:hypothetical protein